MLKCCFRLLDVVIALFILICTDVSYTQTQEILTLDRALSIGLENSYEMKQVESQLAEWQHRVKAWEKSYSSYANLEVYAPVFTNRFSEIADPETGKIRIVRQNNTSYRSSLIISQPILFTDGTLSLYNSLYNLRQGDENTYQYDVTLNINQPLFKTSTRKISLKQAEYNLQKSEINYYRQKRELIYRITEQFLNLLRAKKNLEIARESEERSREVYKLGQIRYRTGLYSEMDLLQVEVDMSNDQNILMNRETNYYELLEQFKLSIGVEREADIDIADTFIIDTVSIGEVELYEKALQNSPERLLNEIDIQITELDIKSAKARRQFTIDMNVEYGFSQIKNELDALFKRPSMTQIANIGFTIPLWDSGQNRESVFAEQEVLTSLEIQLENAIEALKVEIKEIFLSLELVRSVMDLSEKTEEKARKSYQYSVMQFNAGSISSDELAFARQRLNTASLNYLNAKIEYMLTVEQIKKHLTEIPDYASH